MDGVTAPAASPSLAAVLALVDEYHAVIANHAVEGYVGTWPKITEARAALDAELRRLCEDRERIDWLDEMASLHERPLFTSRGSTYMVEFASRHRYDWFHAESLRAAIDAARLTPEPAHHDG